MDADIVVGVTNPAVSLILVYVFLFYTITGKVDFSY